MSVSRPLTMTEKILRSHRTDSGKYRIDSVLFHDMSGIVAFMGYDAAGITRAGVRTAVVFTDHNISSGDPAVASNRDFVRSGAQAFGMTYSLPGNGICHSLYAQRLAKPGDLLIGADSHTATAGAVGMLGIGMGGLDAAIAMSGKPFRLTEPQSTAVYLSGHLRPGVSAKDVSLWLLAKLGIHGAVGKVLEYIGPGVNTLEIYQRMTLANMGAEMGATSSLFPSDECTKQFLERQGRAADYRPLFPDDDAEYIQTVTLDLSDVEPMAALPGRPDLGQPLAECERVSFSQIFIGSCTNGSYTDIARAAEILRDRKIQPDTEVLVSCGSRFIQNQLAKDGYLSILIQAGARILECACGPCMGVDHAPLPGSTILRTSNRNFPGRSGTPDAQMYLCGVETAAASAVTGRLTSVQELLTEDELSVLDRIQEPVSHDDDSMFITYPPNSDQSLRYTDAIRPIPVRPPLEADITAAVSLKLGEGISTDDIVPPLPQILALRPNIPELARHLFCNLDPDFAARAAAMKNSVIAAGKDYAQGSSREHAAAGCMALGVRIVLAQSIHRIHRGNLINYGVIPLLIDSTTLSSLRAGDQLCLRDAAAQLRAGRDIVLENLTQGIRVHAVSDLNQEEIDILEAGGLLPSLHREDVE